MTDQELRLRALKMALDFLHPAEVAIEDVTTFADGLLAWLSHPDGAYEPEVGLSPDSVLHAYRPQVKL